jgi:hypothetical protein
MAVWTEYACLRLPGLCKVWACKKRVMTYVLQAYLQQVPGRREPLYGAGSTLTGCAPDLCVHFCPAVLCSVPANHDICMRVRPPHPPSPRPPSDLCLPG